jgi:hypothetical protein
MATRAQILKQLWNDINCAMQERWIENWIATAKRDPKAPFADAGLALQRLLELGASRRDLSLVARSAAYEAVFSTLYTFSDPGVDDNDVEMLHESLLGADPSGKEGRPGSAPEKL